MTPRPCEYLKTDEDLLRMLHQTFGHQTFTQEMADNLHTWAACDRVGLLARCGLTVDAMYAAPQYRIYRFAAQRPEAADVAPDPLYVRYDWLVLEGVPAFVPVMACNAQVPGWKDMLPPTEQPLRQSA